ncbi:hypothetical protein GUJ93_ZPchr0001g30050 [Zizania palustris]|uniref:Uncharacterized protein n=1 Tax=Zizania palustris TaxID=103762 RepID=A0A8J5RPH3_ZIZPA|nr:hypothetical protein GUJ93_ZPchr0001g30050 [Zizania palustris]
MLEWVESWIRNLVLTLEKSNPHKPDGNEIDPNKNDNSDELDPKEKTEDSKGTSHSSKDGKVDIPEFIGDDSEEDMLMNDYDIQQCDDKSFHRNMETPDQSSVAVGGDYATNHGINLGNDDSEIEKNISFIKAKELAQNVIDEANKQLAINLKSDEKNKTVLTKLSSVKDPIVNEIGEASSSENVT